MKKILLFALLLLVAVSGYLLHSRFNGGGASRQAADMPQTVRVAHVRAADIPVRLQAIGTATSPSTVVVKSRVDGQLMRLHFTEGQQVCEGDLLAEIDPRPFEVQRSQAQGILARDQALLNEAKLDLARYRRLVKEQSVSPQQLQAQESLVGQYQGMVLANTAAVADAELQLSYCGISAPITGRVGLKRVDEGNMIRASDSDGIVVITQTKPMDVVFTLVEKDIPQVLEAMRGKTAPTVETWGQVDEGPRSTGVLLSLDNQIDISSGTVKAKARFDNQDDRLFPNQFVNVRLLVGTLEKVSVIPSSAVQRNNEGFFVYCVVNSKAEMRPVTVSYSTASESVIASGLEIDDIVVTDGVDRLRTGVSVTYTQGKAE